MILVTQTEAAKIAGVTQQAIAELKKSGCWHFFVDSKVDTKSPSWESYLNFRGIYSQPDTTPDFEDDPDDSDLDREMLSVDMDYKRARARKEQEVAKIRTIERKKKDGEVIELSFVESIFFQYLQILNKKILDLPQNLADRTLAIAASGSKEAREELVELWTRQSERLIQQAKDQTKRSLDRYIEDLTK